MTEITHMTDAPVRMTKVVYNSDYGDFGLSPQAIRLARELSGNPSWGDVCLIGDRYPSGAINDVEYGDPEGVERHDPLLVQVVESLGSEKASRHPAKLAIAEIPYGSMYRIVAVDGKEIVETPDMVLTDWVKP